MTFIDGAIKPKLVDQKIYDKVKKFQEENKPFKIDFNIWPSVLNILKTHYTAIIIILFVIILLFYRYYEVKNRKKNNPLNKIVKESDDIITENSENFSNENSI